MFVSLSVVSLLTCTVCSEYVADAVNTCGYYSDSVRNWDQYYIAHKVNVVAGTGDTRLQLLSDLFDIAYNLST